MENNFIKYNRHPQDLKVSDCVVRAISTALNKDYYETRKELNRAKTKLGYKSYKDHFFIMDYMAQLGYEEIKFKAIKGQERMKLCDFADTHQDGTYVVKVKGHVVAVVEGCVLDTWDSTYLTVYRAWKVPNGVSLEELGLHKSFGDRKERRLYKVFIL